MKKLISPEKFFSGNAEFKIGATNFSQIPDSRLVEVAFIGKSNVGKSSLINALLNQRIAVTSKTPGRTRQLNFFSIPEKLIVVDMPGYGFAKVGKKEIESWEKLSYLYFAKRSNLKRVFLLIDSRRGLQKVDEDMINIFNALAISYQIVLTKIDELKIAELERAKQEIIVKSEKLPAAHPEVIITSSETKAGIFELRKAIIDLL